MFFVSAIAVLAAASAVPSGVHISVTMVSSVSSANAKIGDPFVFRTRQDVRAGAVDIPAGTVGHGIVSAVSAAAGTHRGSLSLTPQYLVLASGDRVPVTSADSKYAARRHLFPIPMPFPGVFVVGGLVNPGGNVTIGPGTNFDVVTSDAHSTNLHSVVLSPGKTVGKTDGRRGDPERPTVFKGERAIH